MVQWILGAKAGKIISWTNQQIKRKISLLSARVTRKRRIQSTLPKPNASLLATIGETKMVAVQTAAAKVPANHKFATAFTQRPRIKRL